MYLIVLFDDKVKKSLLNDAREVRYDCEEWGGSVKIYIPDNAIWQVEEKRKANFLLTLGLTSKQGAVDLLFLVDKLPQGATLEIIF
jgi:hypothetical protein